MLVSEILFIIDSLSEYLCARKLDALEKTNRLTAQLYRQKRHNAYLL